MTYDLIGDVHGQFLKLKNVLDHLGYKKKKGVYSKENHCAFFIGDLVDRGENTVEVVDLVKNMVEQGFAEAIMGNHEYNLFGYLTKDDKNNFLRPHTAKNTKQVINTLVSYNKKDKLLEEHLDWMTNLPLYINKPEFRAVHACWDKASYQYIQNNVGSVMSKKNLIESYECGSKLENAVKMMLTGPELKLPKEFSQKDSEGHFRTAMRYAWWNKIKDKTYQEIAIKDSEFLPNIGVDIPDNFESQHYSSKRKPLFFGHYSMKGEPELMTSNVCCLDWVNKRNRIAVYRFKDEKILKAKNLKWFF